MAETRTEIVEIRVDEDVARAREMSRSLGREIGFSEPQQVRFTTAVSELARNVIKYADFGACRFSTYSDQHRSRIETVVEDEGPGIEDIDKALEVGFSSAGTFGAGLPGVRNLVDEFRISSAPNGTRVHITMWGTNRR